ncbi:MAG: hypothetical protein KC535_00740 [Nanoarchaeota archaeon]|nr:hypothetical protein [Nanoarchaeota archaeon]
MKIYLPPYAKNQLETSDDASVWAKKIPFKKKLTKGFTCEAILGEDTLDIPDVIEDGYYYPDRDQALEDVIESMDLLDEPVMQGNISYKWFWGMGNDSYVCAKSNGKELENLGQRSFSIYNPQGYFTDQERLLDTILKERGYIINRRDTRFEDTYQFDPSHSLFAIKDFDKASKNGSTYILFQHKDGGRGWAVLAEKKSSGLYTSLLEDHNDNVRGEMLTTEFIKSTFPETALEFIDKQEESGMDRPYRPTLKDFK